MNEIFLDIETTGLSYRDNHKIVEIACIETKDLIPTKKIFHCLINPQREVPKEAFDVHGFSTEFLKKQKIFEQVSDEFVNFIKNKKLIIHNAPFDVGLINNELRPLKKKEIEKEEVIDTLDIARKKYPGRDNSLDALCKKFNIDLSRRTKHNALLDCELLREVYINLLDIKEPRLVFTEEINSKNKKTLDSPTNYCKRIIAPSLKEEEEHKFFLKKELIKNYY